MNTENNKRLAKNTVILFFRMLLTMLVSLYTSRVVLSTLGVEDFGIYNVVGGFVTLIGFLKSAMATATNRFLAYEIGRNDAFQLRNVFSMSINIQIIIAFIILVLAETIGLWFVNTQINIPEDRMLAARFVFHFSVFALLVNIISVPYNALIMAREKMNIFAYISFIEVGMKLLIVFMLQWFGFDKLKFYAILLFCLEILLRFLYNLYCNLKFSESKYRFFWDISLFKTLVSFAGWNLWGAASTVVKGQGVNILLNIFYGPIVNAARGISYQVSGAVTQFVQTFQLALNPQIIKSYAADDLKYMHQLVFQGAKYSYFLMLILSLPVLLETELILKIWLNKAPDYSVIFTQLIIINILIDSISGPLMTAAQASGNIKLYQGVVGGLIILNLPISYLFLNFGSSPEVTFYISIGISFIALFVRIKFLRFLVKMKERDFYNDVFLKIIIVTFVAIIFPLLIRFFISTSIYRLIIQILISIISCITTIYFFGLSRTERINIVKYINTYQKKYFGTKKC